MDARKADRLMKGRSLSCQSRCRRWASRRKLYPCRQRTRRQAGRTLSHPRHSAGPWPGTCLPPDAALAQATSKICLERPGNIALDDEVSRTIGASAKCTSITFPETPAQLVPSRQGPSLPGVYGRPVEVLSVSSSSQNTTQGLSICMYVARKFLVHF